MFNKFNKVISIVTYKFIIVIRWFVIFLVSILKFEIEIEKLKNVFLKS